MYKSIKLNFRYIVFTIYITILGIMYKKKYIIFVYILKLKSFTQIQLRQYHVIDVIFIIKYITILQNTLYKDGF